MQGAPRQRTCPLFYFGQVGLDGGSLRQLTTITFFHYIVIVLRSSLTQVLYIMLEKLCWKNRIIPISCMYVVENRIFLFLALEYYQS